MQKSSGGKAIASLVLGILGLLAWLLPLIGLPITIVGLVLGMVDRKSERRGLAMAGIVLNALFLALTLANAGYGAYLGATGQLF